MRGDQSGYPGAGLELLLIERVDKLVEHHPACLPPLRHPATGRASSTPSPSSDGDLADYAACDLSSSAPLGLLLLQLHQHRRHLASGSRKINLQDIFPHG